MSKIYLAPTANFVQKTLSGAISDSDVTITLSSTTNLQAPGVVVVDRVDTSGNLTSGNREVIAYTGISSNNLTGCTRAFDNSTAMKHADGAVVETMPVVGMWNNLATIVSSGLDANGYLLAINSPASIAFAQLTQTAVVSIASIARAELSTLALSSIASVARMQTTQSAISSIASIARGEFSTLALQSIASTTAPEFGITNASGNVRVTPGVSALVMLPALVQNDTTNVYQNNNVILAGWGYIAGAAANSVNEAVTFGVTFKSRPYVVASYLGLKDGSNPTTQADVGGNDQAIIASIGPITTTQFTVYIAHKDAGTNLVSSQRQAYSWIAIGEL